MGTKNYDSATDLITFSRASGGTFLGSNGLLQTAANNVPRIEYDATGAVKGLLIEEARTNLLTYSEDFSNAFWQKSECTAVLDATGPDGVTSAFTVTEAATTFSHKLRDSSQTLTAVNYTQSITAKYNGRHLQIRTSGEGGNYGLANFDLQAGTVAKASGTGYVSSTIEDVGNGFYKCSLTVLNTIAGIGYDIGLSPTPATDSDLVSYAGDGTSGIIVYGAQLEVGSFASSYIPTSGASASRAADIASIPTSAFGYNAEGGTVVCDFNMSFDGTNYPRVWEIGSTINNQDRINVFGYAPTGTIGTGLFTAGVGQGGATLSTGNTSPVGPLKAAFAWRENDLASVQDGGTVQTNSVATITGGNPRTVLALGGAADSNGDYMNGHIKSIRYYPRRLSNAQLQELTT